MDEMRNGLCRCQAQFLCAVNLTRSFDFKELRVTTKPNQHWFVSSRFPRHESPVPEQQYISAIQM